MRNYTASLRLYGKMRDYLTQASKISNLSIMEPLKYAAIAKILMQGLLEKDIGLKESDDGGDTPQGNVDIFPYMEGNNQMMGIFKQTVDPNDGKKLINQLHSTDISTFINQTNKVSFDSISTPPVISNELIEEKNKMEELNNFMRWR